MNLFSKGKHRRRDAMTAKLFQLLVNINIFRYPPDLSREEEERA